LYGNPEAQAHDAQTLQRHDLIAFGLPCPQERLRAIVIAFAALLVAGLKLGHRYAIRCEFAHCPTGGVGSMSITKRP
jgi:hypothetical protein